MKLDLIQTIIAVGISALVTFGYYSLTNDANSKVPIAIVVAIEMLLFWIGAIGIKSTKYTRSMTMIRIMCFVEIVLTLSINTFYALGQSNTSFYIINGIFVLISLLIINMIYKSKQ